MSQSMYSDKKVDKFYDFIRIEHITDDFIRDKMHNNAS